MHTFDTTIYFTKEICIYSTKLDNQSSIYCCFKPFVDFEQLQQGSTIETICVTYPLFMKGGIFIQDKIAGRSKVFKTFVAVISIGFNL